MCVGFLFCNQKTAYEMRISDWSSDVCSSDLVKAEELQAQGKTVLFFLGGRKGRAVISRVFPRQTIAQYDTTGIRDIGYDEAQEIAAQVMELFEQGKFDVAHLFYSRFRSALLQEATSRQIIPVAIPADADAGSDAAVEYEPDEPELLDRKST